MGFYVFGADGGGTKTVGLIADLKGTILARRHAGGSNPNVAGLESSVETLHPLIAACCADAQCRVQDLGSLVIGLAGGGRADVRRELHNRLAERAGHDLPLVIETDARVALEGAFEGGPGIVIIAGTGSVVIGKSTSHEIVIAGGWGRVLGDEGSAYWLGLEALKAAMSWHEYRGGSQHLAEVIGREFGVSGREQIIAALAGGFEIARVAPLVVRAAEEGDPGASEILHRGARALVRQAQMVAGRMGGMPEIPVVCTGGAGGQPFYASVLKTHVEQQMHGARVQAPLHDAAFGAVMLALQHVSPSQPNPSH